MTLTAVLLLSIMLITLIVVITKYRNKLFKEYFTYNYFLPKDYMDDPIRGEMVEYRLYRNRTEVRAIKIKGGDGEYFLYVLIKNHESNLYTLQRKVLNNGSVIDFQSRKKLYELKEQSVKLRSENKEMVEWI